MSLIDQFYLYNMRGPDEEAATTSASNGESRAGQLRSRLYQSYFSSSGRDNTAIPPSYRDPAYGFQGGEYADACRNDGDDDAQWLDHREQQQQEEEDIGGFQESQDDDEAEEEIMLMTDEEKQHFAEELTALEGNDNRRLYGGNANARGNDRNKIGSDMYHRNFRWKEKLIESTSLLREELTTHESKDCTFSPTINKHSVSITAKVQQRGASAERKPNPYLVSERLTKATGAREAKVRMIQEDKARQELRNCTFKPRVVRSAWVKGVTPRYLDEPPKSDPAEYDTAMAECTFKPTTNRRVAGGLSTLTSVYLAVPAYARLSHDAVVKRQKLRELETTVSTIGAATSASNTPSRKRHPAATPFKNFYDRMEESELEKQKNLLKLQEEQAVATPFKPTIVVLRKKAPVAAEGGGAPESPHRYHRQCKEYQHPEEKQATYQPQINRVSMSLPRNVEDLHKFLVKRNSKMTKLERQVKDEEMEGVTFCPQVSQFSKQIGGRLQEQTSKDVEGYTMFVEMQKRVKQSQLQQIRSELLARDNAELTFHPTVHEAPPLIREIAAEVRRTREASKHAPPSTQKKMVTPLRF